MSSPTNRARACIAILAWMSAACGSDSTGPSPLHAGVNIVSGAGVTDTVDALLSAPLTIRVADASGKPVAHAAVHFSTLDGHSDAYNIEQPTAFVAGADGYHTNEVVDSTDATGTASVRVQLGWVPGPGGVAVSVPALGVEDTARYTLRVGAPAVATVSVKDTTLTAGAAMILSSRVTDRHANVRPEQATLRASSSAITLNSTGASLTSVSTSSPGRAAIVASYAAAKSETAWVSVVPSGTIAARISGRLATMLLDGTHLHVIPTSLNPGDPQWTLDGSALLAQLGPFPSLLSLYRVDMNGAYDLVLSAGAPPFAGTAFVPAAIKSFALAQDGGIITSSGGCNYSAELFRTPPGSTSLATRLSPPAGPGQSDCFDTVHLFPSPSPDGTRVVFEYRTSYFSGFSIRVLDLATTTITGLYPSGRQPSWSPTGALIAFQDAGRIWVIGADGSNARPISPTTHIYQYGVSWSPDGRWILARFGDSADSDLGTVALLEVATGLEIPLPFTRPVSNSVFGQPAWRPVP